MRQKRPAISCTLSACQLVAVDHVQRKVVAGLFDAGQVAHRPAQRHQTVARLRSEPVYRPQVFLQEVVQPGYRRRFGLFETEKQVAQTQRAQRQADGAARQAAADLDDLRAAAAQVDDVAFPQPRAVDCAQRAVIAFLLAGKQPRLPARLGADARQEGCAVLCVAHGAGGGHDHVVHALRAAETGEHAHGLGGAVDGRRAQHHAVAHPLAQAHHLAHLVGQVEAIARLVLVNHQAGGVGSQVNDGDALRHGITLYTTELGSPVAPRQRVDTSIGSSYNRGQ